MPVNERIEPKDCIFCRIVAGEAPAHVVREDERTLAFMDLFPVADGHVLVIPKAHCHNLLDAELDDLRAVAERSRSVARAIRDILDPDGIGTFQLNGSAAGQTVFHYHLHLIPRRAGEGLQIHGRGRGDPARLAEVASQLSQAVAAAEG
jgi:histidine triad (HIT) family protein